MAKKDRHIHIRANGAKIEEISSITGFSITEIIEKGIDMFSDRYLGTEKRATEIIRMVEAEIEILESKQRLRVKEREILNLYYEFFKLSRNLSFYRKF